MREREFIYSDEKPRIVNNDYAEDISPTDEIKQRATTAISIVVVRNALGSESTNSHMTRWPATRRRCGERTAVALAVTRVETKQQHDSGTSDAMNVSTRARTRRVRTSDREGGNS